MIAIAFKSLDTCTYGINVLLDFNTITIFLSFMIEQSTNGDWIDNLHREHRNFNQVYIQVLSGETK